MYLNVMLLCVPEFSAPVLEMHEEQADVPADWQRSAWRQ